MHRSEDAFSARGWRYPIGQEPNPIVTPTDTETMGDLLFEPDRVRFGGWEVPFAEITEAEFFDSGLGLGVLRLRTNSEVFDLGFPTKRLPRDIPFRVEEKTFPTGSGPARAFRRGKLIGVTIFLPLVGLLWYCGTR
jgi:hypothetical protein